MELGHDASAETLASLRAPSSDSVGGALLHVNMQLSSALNNYLCASFLTGKIKTGGVGSDDETAIRAFISVFNRIASSTPVDEFSRGAKVLQEFLSKHTKCRF
jgi:hypothetical protein